jgi:hypothetical protein
MLFCVWFFTAIIDKDMMVLQSYTNLENVLVGPHGETYRACHDVNEAMYIKDEGVTNASEEEDPLRITIQEIKAEPEVSCVPLYGHC